MWLKDRHLIGRELRNFENLKAVIGQMGEEEKSIAVLRSLIQTLAELRSTCSPEGPSQVGTECIRYEVTCACTYTGVRLKSKLQHSGI